MIAYDWAVVGGIVLDLWLLALVLLRSHRTWLKATYAALALAFIVNGSAYVGRAEGALSPDWSSVVLWTMILVHPLAAILVLALLHGEGVLRRRAVAFLLLLAVPELLVVVPGTDWAVRHAYDLNPLGAFLVACLAIALAEPIYQRSMSPLLAPDAFWLIVGVVALVIGGPVYTYEFEALGLAGEPGSNLAAPMALAIFAGVALRADPYPVPRLRRSRASGEGHLVRGQSYVFDEARPAYALHAAREEAHRGRSVLVLARGSSPPAAESRGLAAGFLEASPRGALRTLATGTQFFADHPGGLLVLADLGDLVLMSGWTKTREMVVRLRQAAKDTQSTFVVSGSRLLEHEKEDLRGTRVAWWPLPQAAKEAEAILARSFGSGAGQLLTSYAASRGLRVEDLTADDVPSLVAFLGRAIDELGGAVADNPARTGLRSQAATAARELQTFAALTPAQLAEGSWPSRAVSEADREILVTAADYWKGKEMDELFAAAEQLQAEEPLYERARTIFREQLGDAGEGVLRSELAKLGKRPDELRPEDVARLADRAAVDLSAMADVVDVPQEKLRIQSQIDSIRRRLEAIAGDRA